MVIKEKFILNEKLSLNTGHNMEFDNDNYKVHIIVYKNIRDTFFPRMKREDYFEACRKIEDQLINKPKMYSEDFNKFCYDIFRSYLD